MSDTTQAKPRQLVLLCDGTSNNLTGGHHDTNVVKLGELLRKQKDVGNDVDQILWYDAGVGHAWDTVGATSWDRLRKLGDRIGGLAMGRGVFENIAEGYTFLMQHWREGDEIYLFGFSRGAFTARSIGGLINMVGLLPAHQLSSLPTLINLYFAKVKEEGREGIAAQLKRFVVDAENRREVEVRFVGVWDTVEAVGFGPMALEFSSNAGLEGKCFRHVRQALSLDEHRTQFRPRLYTEPNGTFKMKGGEEEGSLIQLWFRGAHSDAGGGYKRDESWLSNTTLAWVVSEASHCGLRIGFHQGLSEPEVSALLCEPSSPGPLLDAGSRAIVHSELSRHCLWALTGLNPRDTTHTRPGEAAPKGQEHPSVAASRADVAGSHPPGLEHGRLAAGLFALSLLLLPAINALLSPHARDLTAFGLSAMPPLPDLFRWWGWQMLWPVWQGTPAGEPAALWQAWRSALDGFGSPAWALLLGTVSAAGCGFGLAWVVSWSFLRRCGLRRVGDPVPGLLRNLGRALPVLVVATLAEGLASLAVLALFAVGAPVLAAAVALVMALCAVAKWAMLAVVLALLGWTLLPSRRREPQLTVDPTGAAGP